MQPENIPNNTPVQQAPAPYAPPQGYAPPVQNPYAQQPAAPAGYSPGYPPGYQPAYQPAPAYRQSYGQSPLMDQYQIKSIFSRIGLCFALFMLIPQVLAGVLSMVVAALWPQVTTQGWYMWVLSYVPMYCIAFPIFLQMMKSVPDVSSIPGAAAPQPRGTLGVGKLLQIVLISMGIVYSMNMVINGISSGIQQLLGAGLNNPLEAAVMNSDPFINFAAVCIVAPIMEEIVFRRVLYGKLIAFGEQVYVFFSAFLFSLFHANIYQMGYAFVLGLVFAYITAYTGTIRYSIILHMLINILGSGISPFLLHYGSLQAVSIYGFFLIGLMLAGIIMLIYWLARHFKSIRFAPPSIPIPNKKVMFVNGGMMFYMILIAILALIVMLSSLLMSLLSNMIY